MRVRAGGGQGQSCSLRFILGACWHSVWAREHVSISATELTQPKPPQWALLGDVYTGRLWPPVMSPGVHPGPLRGQNVGLGVGWRRGSSQGQIHVSPQVLEARQNHTQESAASTCCPITGENLLTEKTSSLKVYQNIL